MGVYHSFEKIKPQLCFFFLKPFLVTSIFLVLNIETILYTQTFLPFSRVLYFINILL